jgi:ribosome-associated toxin RatA of RatAB toxin-antitoxin module
MQLLIFAFSLACLIGGIWLGSSVSSKAQTFAQTNSQVDSQPILQPIPPQNPLQNPLLRALTESERASLNTGMPILSGEEGKYTVKILVNANSDRVWKVMTDYNSFPKFLPTVTAIKILENNGNQKVYEQVNTVQVLIFSQSSRVVIASTETYPSLISFQMREGDSIASLKGTWKIDSISPTQVLLANQVTVEPGASVPRDFFFNLYGENLTKTLSALKQEMEKL